MNSSERENELFNAVDEAIKSIYEKHIVENRLLGRESVDKLLMYVKMIIAVKNLVKNRDLEENVLQELHRSFFGDKRSEVLDKRTIVYESRMNILRNIHPGSRVKASNIFSGNPSLSDILDYIWLRKKGFLKKGRDGFLRADQNIYSEELEQVSTRTIDLEDIYRYLREIPSSLWWRIVNQELFKRMSNEDLVRFTNEYYGYNTRIDHRLIDEIKKRIGRGWRPDWRVWREMEEIMGRSMGSSVYLGPYSLKRYRPVGEEDIYRDIIRDFKNLPLSERWKILPRIRDERVLENIVNNVDPLTLSKLSGLDRFKPFLKNKVLIGQALGYYLSYLVSREQSYLDYSLYILSKIDLNNLEPVLKPIYRSILERNNKLLFNMLSQRYPLDVVEYLSNSVWDYISTQGFNREIVWNAVRVGYEVLKYSIRGFDYVGRYVDSTVYGRVSVRKTIYNYARYNYLVVKKHREKYGRVVALVDVSGSMLRYSTWAVLSLSTIIPIVKYIVLFSDKAYVYKPPRKSSKSLIINYLEKLFIDGFHGYTNISGAIRVLNTISSSNDNIIMFSDLEQTVPDTDPWVEVEKYLTRKGGRFIVFAPPRYSSETAGSLSKLGVDVVVVNDPYRIPYLLKRKLNLKIRVNIFPFKRCEYR